MCSIITEHLMIFFFARGFAPRTCSPCNHLKSDAMFEQLKNPGSGWETMKSLLSALSITACTITAAATTGGLAAGTAQAQSFQPAIVFDMGGKFDKSFNEAAYVGVERF